MTARRVIAHSAFAIVFVGSFATIHAGTAWAEADCAAKPAFYKKKKKSKNIDPAIAVVQPGPEAIWKTVEYLNRPIASFLCNGANKAQIICYLD